VQPGQPILVQIRLNTKTALAVECAKPTKPKDDL
jgi:hypothetical protein